MIRKPESAKKSWTPIHPLAVSEMVALINNCSLDPAIQAALWMMTMSTASPRMPSRGKRCPDSGPARSVPTPVAPLTRPPHGPRARDSVRPMETN